MIHISFMAPQSIKNIELDRLLQVAARAVVVVPLSNFVCSIPKLLCEKSFIPIYFLTWKEI